jgi:multidrug efflux system outer membrane protein
MKPVTTMKRFALTLIAAAALSACSLAPKQPDPQITVPTAYKQAMLSAQDTAGTRWKAALPAEAAARGAWWEAFGDAPLNALQAQAAQASPTLALAAARVKAARASLRGLQADRWPQLGLNAGATRQRQPAAALGLPAATPTSAATLYQVGLGASYEIDLFGRVSSNANAANADAQAAEASYRSVLLALQADVAQTYFALRALDAEIAQIEATVTLRNENALLIEKRFKAGDVGELDLARSRTDLATVQAEAAALRGARARLEHTLALLLGQTPAAFSFAPAPLTDTAPVPSVPPGLPSALLERRPDVAAAQLDLQAATARVGAVRAALFPALTLTANAGHVSGDVDDLFKWSSRAWLASLVLSLRIIDGGRNAAAVTRAEAALDGAVANYRQTVLGAFADVEDQLAQLRAVREQVALTDTAVASARRAAELANIRYRAGEDSYLQFIDTQRGLLAIQRQAVRLRGEWANSTVGLIRALGGGWDARAAE